MTKIDIISGFLGAGKTTLINKLLAEFYLAEKTALLENEFGEINIDKDLIKSNVAVKEISNGCICCSLQGDFVDGLVEIVETYNPDRIIIEPTGLGMLKDVVAACNKAASSIPVEINAIITVVNAEAFTAFLHVGGEFFIKQIEDAGVIVLSAVQNLTTGSGELESTISEIKKLNPNAHVFSQCWDTLDSLELIAIAEARTAAISYNGWSKTEHSNRNEGCEHNEHEHTVHHDKGFRSYSAQLIRISKKSEIESMIGFFNDGVFGTVYRAKGFFTTESGALKMNYVMGKGTIEECTYEGISKFVVIGTGLNKVKLDEFTK